MDTTLFPVIWIAVLLLSFSLLWWKGDRLIDRIAGLLTRFLVEAWVQVLRSGVMMLRVVLAMVVSLVYVVMPADLIPDVILGLGQIDDFLVFCLSHWMWIARVVRERTEGDIDEKVRHPRIMFLLRLGTCGLLASALTGALLLLWLTVRPV